MLIQFLILLAPISQNGHTHSKICRRIVWVCLTIFWDWRLKAKKPSPHLFDRVLNILFRWTTKIPAKTHWFEIPLQKLGQILRTVLNNKKSVLVYLSSYLLFSLPTTWRLKSKSSKNKWTNKAFQSAEWSLPMSKGCALLFQQYPALLNTKIKYVLTSFFENV